MLFKSTFDEELRESFRTLYVACWKANEIIDFAKKQSGSHRWWEKRKSYCEKTSENRFCLLIGFPLLCKHNTSWCNITFSNRVWFLIDKSYFGSGFHHGKSRNCSKNFLFLETSTQAFKFAFGAGETIFSTSKLKKKSIKHNPPKRCRLEFAFHCNIQQFVALNRMIGRRFTLIWSQSWIELNKKCKVMKTSIMICQCTSLDLEDNLR